MAATFWERATGFGEGASDMLDLDLLETSFALAANQVITWAAAKAWLGLTQEQSDELDLFLGYMGAWHDLHPFLWARELRFIMIGARAGQAALNSIPDVWAAIGFAPS